MKLFFYSPKHLENLAAIVRTLEVFGIKEIFIYDFYGVISSEHKKAYKRKLNKISAGSFQYLKFHKVSSPLTFIKNYSQRTIASVLKNENCYLPHFKFQKNDILIMGNETEGVPNEITNEADVLLKIPQTGKTESLNLATATGIFVYEYFKQTNFMTQFNDS